VHEHLSNVSVLQRVHLSNVMLMLSEVYPKCI
jgi:hypothetical protein